MADFPTKVLLATDGSGNAEKPSPEERSRLEQEARDVLVEQVKKIDNLGGEVIQSHLKMGKPDADIVSLAEVLDAGLILMDNRGRGGVRRALMGSVSDSVVRHAHCPVLVVVRRRNVWSRVKQTF